MEKLKVRIESLENLQQPEKPATIIVYHKNEMTKAGAITKYEKEHDIKFTDDDELIILEIVDVVTNKEKEDE